SPARSSLFPYTTLFRSKSFEELKIPFYAIATDWNRACTVAFSNGDDLVDAVIASCSVPVIFNPQYIHGKPYVDGGLLKNFPVSRSEEHTSELQSRENLV